MNKKELPLNAQTKDLTDDCKGRCVTVSSNNEFIAVGFMDGSVKVPFFQIIYKLFIGVIIFKIIMLYNNLIDNQIYNPETLDQ